MSKSLGNTMAPQKISGTLGAEILRLWVASTDYSGELAISDEILKRVVESYRRIRNTLRFLLANTSDFDPKKHAVPLAELVEIDRYAIALSANMQKGVLAGYAAYEFHLVAQKLLTFCSEDLGSFYLDILKDRLYTCGADSAPRRSAQTALWHITNALLRLMAPILSFTAEEAWTLFARGEGSVFFETFHQFPTVDVHYGEWETIRKVTTEVQKQLEVLRVKGDIGSSLAAEVAIESGSEYFPALSRIGDELRYVFRTSGVELIAGAGKAQLDVRASASANPKCERCWHYRADVNGEGLCGRCVSNLKGPGESRKHA
jgi:isoleucyl-tRNA synthetase